MTFRPSNVPTLLALTAVAVLAVAACDGGDSSLGPPTSTGATDIGGPPMTSAPPPPPGWNPKDVVPQSQQQAQDTVTGYLTRILQALPPGTVLDGSRYAGAGHNSSCEDEPLGPGKPPMRFHTIGELTFPQGVDQVAMIQQLGDIWRSWGWYVFEREGFPKPNQFGYGPDGYRLQVEAADPPSYPPALKASSPCFPGELANDDLPFPESLTG